MMLWVVSLPGGPLPALEDPSSLPMLPYRNPCYYALSRWLAKNCRYLNPMICHSILPTLARTIEGRMRFDF